jgi:hypothetical protein
MQTDADFPAGEIERVQKSKKPTDQWAKCLIYLGWLMGLEPTTTGIKILIFNYL